MCNMWNVWKAWIMRIIFRICMKCFLKHDYVLEVLHEVKWHDCMIMKCKEYELWNMMQCYACQEWNDACLIEMRMYEMRTK